MFTNKQPKPIDSVQTIVWETLAIFLNFWKSRQNQAQNLHIISFEAAALSAEWWPATQVAMCPIAAKGLHGQNAGTKWKSACLGFRSFKGLAHNNKTSKVT